MDNLYNFTRLRLEKHLRKLAQDDAAGEGGGKVGHGGCFVAADGDDAAARSYGNALLSCGVCIRRLPFRHRQWRAHWQHRLPKDGLATVWRDGSGQPCEALQRRPAAGGLLIGSNARDGNGCIPELNAISNAHASHLLSTVDDLQSRHADATFTFLDFFDAYIDVLQTRMALDVCVVGFNNTLDAYCGAGPNARNRFNRLVFCSATSTTATSTLYPDPNVFFSWDGIHSTNRLTILISERKFGSGAFLKPSNPFATCS
ncbi:hypothetical protein L7F22_026704 [Adiantum nelumboides]|nr:hypothetical protein [Adiantum nelumboides]